MHFLICKFFKNKLFFKKKYISNIGKQPEMHDEQKPVLPVYICRGNVLVYRHIICVHESVKYKSQNSDNFRQLRQGIFAICNYVYQETCHVSVKGFCLCLLLPCRSTAIKDMRLCHNCTWFWVFKRRSLYLYSKHFTNLAIFPAPMKTLQHAD